MLAELTSAVSPTHRSRSNKARTTAAGAGVPLPLGCWNRTKYSYDEVDNPTEIHDWRTASEWPDGAKPVTRKIQYDDLYRVSRVDYQYEAGTDPWTSPFDKEDHTPASDMTRPKPAPHVDFAKRIQQQTFSYDWLGNNAQTGDDADGFYDRSLGAITNDSAHSKPYQLVGATNVETATKAGRTGKLSAKYDDAGNLTRLVVHRGGPCLPDTAQCSQDFVYQWDEVGRLVDARRWDFDSSIEPGLSRTANSPLPSAATPPVPTDAHLEYSYDSSDQRVRKTAIVGADERHTLYPMASLELRRALWNETAGAYSRSETTETPYLFGHGVRLARLAYDASLPQSSASNLHTFIEVGDHLGSTSVAVDRATGELAERMTYQANGATESDYRPGRWGELREDYRFTGKEEDVEVGLQYFGKRFLSPQLGQWVSADPLAVHAPGKADLNVYAYVHGQLLRAVDPVGLDEQSARETQYFRYQSPDPNRSGSMNWGEHISIMVGAERVTESLPGLRRTWYEYYGSHSMERATGQKQREMSGLDRAMDTSPGGGTFVRAGYDVTRMSSAGLGAMLMHELKHTQQVASFNESHMQYAEGEGYGVEYFFASRFGARADELNRIQSVVNSQVQESRMRGAGNVSLSQTRDFALGFERSFLTLKVLSDIRDRGATSVAGAPTQGITQGQAGNLIEQYVSRGEGQWDPSLARLADWAKQSGSAGSGQEDWMKSVQHAAEGNPDPK